MVVVNDAGRALLVQTGYKMEEFRGLKTRIERQMREALEAETLKYQDDLARLVARMLDQGVPKAQIATACGYKNYYVSLKSIDEQAQKYRGINTTAQTEPPVPEEQGGPLEWEILTQGEWSEANQWGEQEILLGLKVGGQPVSVYVTKDEIGSTISYVDLPENPDVSVSDVKALKNEILGALSV